MFIRAKYVLQFSRGDDLQNTGFDPAIENLRIVWTCIFETGGGRVEGSISYNNRFHIAQKYPTKPLHKISAPQAHVFLAGKFFIV